MKKSKRPILSKNLAALLGLAVAGASGCVESTALYGAPVTDEDGDGYFAGEDCDDNDATVHPGAEDTVGDGIDQNCDGEDGVAGDTGSE